MDTDARLSTRAIRQPVAAMDNLLQAADELAYSKGEAVLGMFEAWLGPAVFQKGIRDYLAAHEGGNATADDLWKALSSASGKDVGRAMGSFLDQPGVPLVHVEILEGGKAVRLTQRRFVRAGATPPSSLWQVPVGLQYSDGNAAQTRTILLAARSQDVKLEVANPPVIWIAPNAGARGYYRWTVARPLLLNMAQQASSRLDRRERIGFVGNLSALLDAGEIGGGDFFRLLAAFADDAEPLVVSAVVTALDQVRTALVAPDTRAAFATYVRRTLGHALERISPTPQPGEPDSAATLRPLLLWWVAVEGDDRRLQAYAHEVARSYLSGLVTADPASAAAALEIEAATRGDRALFEAIGRKIDSTTGPAERARLFAALGRFRDPRLAGEALDRPGRTFQDGAALTRAMASSAEGSARVFAWYRQHYDDLAGRMPPMFLAFLPDSALGQACTEERLAEVRQFFGDPRRNVAGTDKELAMRAEQVHDCMALRAREGAAAAAYLRAADPR
jgi:alanyl aminopeptidase